MTLNPDFIEGLHGLLENDPHIIITNHTNPDGDAMGSAIALGRVLKALGFKTDVIVPNAYPAFLQWMKGEEDVLRFEEAPEDCAAKISNADIIFCLDFNSMSRSGIIQDTLKSATAKKIIIDHHQQPEDFAELMLSEPKMSSTCEMIFHLIDGMGWMNKLDKDTADCLYTGLITDTGNFRYSATTPTTHKVASVLLERGVESNWVASQVYDNNAPNRYKLLGRALENMQVLDNLKTTILHLSEQELEQFNYVKGDTEGFVNYGLAIKGIIIAVFFVEKDGKVKISFRSKGTFDVNQLARTHFNGGGHTNAAGGISYISLEASIKKLKEILPDYQDELENYQL